MERRLLSPQAGPTFLMKSFPTLGEGVPADLCASIAQGRVGLASLSRLLRNTIRCVANFRLPASHEGKEHILKGIILDDFDYTLAAEACSTFKSCQYGHRHRP